jgi:hypothetical protein
MNGPTRRAYSRRNKGHADILGDATAAIFELGDRHMAEYRAYIMTDDDHIIRAINLDCKDDDAAKEQAKQLVDGHDVELWQLGRKVAILKHNPQ